MSLKSFLKISLIAALIFLAMPVSGLQILYTGVKINSQPLATEAFLLSRAELDDFLKAKEDLKASQAIIAEKNSELKGQRAAIELLIDQVGKATEKIMSLADKLDKSADDKDALLAENARANRRARRANIFNLILTGLSLGRLK
ncbi:MAG: hypothetical protein BWY14_01230 [Parcubacteria group bacterium ADurb.Bin192]|nr:MAG: hypothetical protein BWY14_01230 [Parcubacteria group bacterium ADurb.Bin192]